MELISKEDAIKAIKSLCMYDGEIAQHIWSSDAMDAIRGVPARVTSMRADGGPRVLAREEIGDSGAGWMEKWFMGDEEDDDYKALFHVAWAEGYTVELDERSCPSYGKLDDMVDYNRSFGWRVWTEKPTWKLIYNTPWGKA